MKNTLKAITTLLLAVGLATSAPAQRANSSLGKGVYQSVKTAEQIESMKKGDRYAVVCKQCDSITVKEITDDKEAAALCHDGGSLHCDACKKEVKIKRVGPRKNVLTTKVEYVNAEGEPCMFIVPIKE